MKERRAHGWWAMVGVLVLSATFATMTPARAADAPAPKDTRAPKAAEKPHESKPRDMNDPWDSGATWISVRFGMAKASYDNAGSGNIGGGFGFSRMIWRKWSLGGYAQYDVLGRFGRASESEAPFTLEFARHMDWGAGFHPYIGLGGGTYYHKTYRTSTDFSNPRGGGYLVLGANTPVSTRDLLGVDMRFGYVKGDMGRTNPVFGTEKAKSVHWGVKLNWSVMY